MSNVLDIDYLPSLTVANTSEIFEQWKARAMATQAKFHHQSDLRFGPHPRELLDFYPAPNAKGCVVFIHGGYWLGFSKFETSWVAEGFVGQGVSVALLNYPLCPEVKIADIRTSCAKGFAYLYQNVLSSAEREAVVVSGHSAGGHLAAAYLLEDWNALGLPTNPIKGVISLSGVFDVAPLIQTSLNKQLQLDAAQSHALNLIAVKPRNTASVVLAVGEKESVAFHLQSADLAKSWRQLRLKVVNIPAANHFTIVDHLAAEKGALNRLAVDMVGR